MSDTRIGSTLLAEFPGDVERLAPLADASSRWVALTPTAVDELAVRGLPCLMDDAVCPPEELNRIGHANFARAEALAGGYDRAVINHYPAIGELRLRPFGGHFTRIKFFLDAITIRLAILRCLHPGGAGAVCKVRGSRQQAKTDVDLFYRDGASLYEDLLELLAAQSGLAVSWVPSVVGLPPHSAWRFQARSVASRLAAEIRGAVQRASAWPGLARGQRVLVLGMGFDLRQMMRWCRSAGAEAFWLDGARGQLRRLPGGGVYQVRGVELRPELEAAVSRLELAGDGDPAEVFCRDGSISYAALVRGALQTYLREGFSKALRLQALLQAAHRQLGIDRVFSPSGPERMLSSAVFDFCRHAHIPVTVMQHGIYGHVDNPITNYYEFGFDGDFLAWGSGVEAQYGPTKRGAVRFVPVGSPTLDRLVARRPCTARKLRRVMYITTDLRGTSAYFPGGQIGLDATYYAFQQRVLTLLACHQDRYELWLKVPPSMEHNTLAHNPIRAWLKAKGLRVRIDARPLVRVIREPALFLIDFPSTTLVQCLATRAEVIAFTGSPHFSLLPEARRLLAQRATCCDSPEEFLHAIQATLERGIRPMNEHCDDAFLSRFGTFRHDGASGQRLRTYLQEKGRS